MRQGGNGFACAQYVAPLPCDRLQVLDEMPDVIWASSESARICCLQSRVSMWVSSLHANSAPSKPRADLKCISRPFQIINPSSAKGGDT